MSAALPRMPANRPLPQTLAHRARSLLQPRGARGARAFGGTWRLRAWAIECSSHAHVGWSWSKGRTAWRPTASPPRVHGTGAARGARSAIRMQTRRPVRYRVCAVL